MSLHHTSNRQKIFQSIILVFLTVLVGNTAIQAAEIEKSPNDDREYRALVLANGLKVTLIHDAESDTAAASMDVAIGAGSDPRDRCLLYTSPSPRDGLLSRMPSSA